MILGAGAHVPHYAGFFAVCFERINYLPMWIGRLQQRRHSVALVDMICGEGVVIDEIAMLKPVRNSKMYEFFWSQ